MFPRNIRKIHPWKISQLVSIFNELNRNSEYEWHGKQDIQDRFCKLLEETGLKRVGDQYDPKSGGPRTYYKQLELLGLVFTKPDKTIHLTIAGEKILNGEPPVSILQRMLLRLQYPSVYSKSMNVKINPDIKVRPFEFVLKLLRDPRIEYLKSDDFSIPVIWGHSDSDLELCIQKVLKIRSGKLEISDLIDDKDLLYTHKTVGRTIENALVDVKDIGNTCKNYLQSCGLIAEFDKSIFATNVKVYCATEYSLNLLKEIEGTGYIDSNVSDEAFQREFGKLNNKRDTRVLLGRSVEVAKKDPEYLQIKRSLLKIISETGAEFDKSQFISLMKNEYGFADTKIEKVLDDYFKDSRSSYEERLIEVSTGGIKTANEFEKIVTSIFGGILDFKASHIGQKHRSAGTGAYTDIIVDISGEEIVLIDTKASPSYSLGSNDFAKISSNYIKNYKELRPSSSLNSFGVVAGGFKGNVESRLREIKELTGVPAFAITASALVRLSSYIENKTFGKADILRLFSSCSVITILTLAEEFGDV
ncbi:restriction endonuclease FokI, C-terminal domain protein [Bacteriovorax sp. BSW11_IV]|nr:restriction endonuclease FokI, C-terminal domain protein [Bacteriovorax sp. BSW11_IV]